MPKKLPPPSKKAKVTEEHKREAELLMAIWKSTKRPSQAEFGEAHGIGNQSAVGQFLRGETALSLKAAKGFALGLGCSISSFSPRLAAQAESLTMAVGTGSPTIDQNTRLDDLNRGVHQGDIRAVLERLAREIALTDPASRKELNSLFSALSVGPDSKETIEAIASHIENAPPKGSKEKSKYPSPAKKSDHARAA